MRVRIRVRETGFLGRAAVVAVWSNGYGRAARRRDILISPPDEGRICNILIREDGASKISDPPSGMSVLSGWTAEDELIFDIFGYVPPTDATFWVRTIQEYRGTFSSDEVSLVTSPDGDDYQGSTDAFASDRAPTRSDGSPPTTSANACTVVREQSLILELTGPDVQPTMPAFYAQWARDDNGFPSPQLNWSAVPPETTEIVILVMSLSDDRAALYGADADLWWGGGSQDNISGIPIGATRWTLTGIDAAARSLARTSLSSPPPPGTTEHFLNGTGTRRGGVDLSNKFVGASRDGESYLFTVFALCDPTEGEPDDYGAGWFKRHSIATGWFISRAAWE